MLLSIYQNYGLFAFTLRRKLLNLLGFEKWPADDPWLPLLQCIHNNIHMYMHKWPKLAARRGWRRIYMCICIYMFMHIYVFPGTSFALFNPDLSACNILHINISKLLRLCARGIKEKIMLRCFEGKIGLDLDKNITINIIFFSHRACLLPEP